MSKKIYIYEHLEKITTNFHGDGGVVVVTAGDPSEAWRRRNERIAAEYGSDDDDLEPDYLDPGYIIQELPKPDRVIEVSADTQDAVYVFANAGCC